MTTPSRSPRCAREHQQKTCFARGFTRGRSSKTKATTQPHARHCRRTLNSSGRFPVPGVKTLCSVNASKSARVPSSRNGRFSTCGRKFTTTSRRRSSITLSKSCNLERLPCNRRLRVTQPADKKGLSRRQGLPWKIVPSKLLDVDDRHVLDLRQAEPSRILDKSLLRPRARLRHAFCWRESSESRIVTPTHLRSLAPHSPGPTSESQA